MPDADSLPPALLGGPLPAGFERWRTVLPVGLQRRTHAREWADALVLIEKGTVEVGCLGGGQRRFVAGDLLALGWLPLKWIRNPGTGEACLVALRRRGARPIDSDVRVERRTELASGDE